MGPGGVLGGELAGAREAELVSKHAAQAGRLSPGLPPLGLPSLVVGHAQREVLSPLVEPPSSSDALGPQRPRSLRSARVRFPTLGAVVVCGSEAGGSFSVRGPSVSGRSSGATSSAGGVWELAEEDEEEEEEEEEDDDDEEEARKRALAADWFRYASSINASQADTLQERMEAFRVRRSASKEAASSDCGNMSAPPVLTIDEKMRAFRIRRLEAASSDCSREIPHGYKQDTPRSPVSKVNSGGSTTTAGSTHSQSSSSGSADTAAMKPTEGEAKKHKRSILARFGYGMMAKWEPKREPVDTSAYLKRRSVTVEIKAGNDDLLQRLRRPSRSKTAPEMTAGGRAFLEQPRRVSRSSAAP